MKLPVLTTFFISLLFMSCSNGQSGKSPIPPTMQNKTIDSFEYTFKTAHRNAQALMKEDFFWSPIEETAPFGSDDGFDAAYSFREWRIQNKTKSPVIFLNNLIRSWEYPFFDYNEMDTSKIKEYIYSMANPNEIIIQQRMKIMKEALKNLPDSLRRSTDDKQLRESIILSSRDLGGTYLLGQDNAIIATGFAQFVLEGHIDNDIKALTITAIKRQLLPMLINRYEDDYREIRKEQLEKMLGVIKKVN